jgi:hypothetical protein
VEPPEDAVRVLRHVLQLVRRDGVVLDLTTIPPAAVVERGGVSLGALEQTAFLARAVRTEEAVDAMVAEGLLVEEARLEHDVLKHFDSRPELVDDVGQRAVTRLPQALRERLDDVDGPLVERSFCLLRRLRVLPG